MDRRVTSPTWGLPPLCKQALNYLRPGKPINTTRDFRIENMVPHRASLLPAVEGLSVVRVADAVETPSISSITTVVMARSPIATPGWAGSLSANLTSKASSPSTSSSWLLKLKQFSLRHQMQKLQLNLSFHSLHRDWLLFLT